MQAKKIKKLLPGILLLALDDTPVIIRFPTIFCLKIGQVCISIINQNESKDIILHPQMIIALEFWLLLNNIPQLRN